MAAHKHLDYNKDFYQWALSTARLLRSKKFEQIDIKNLAEEIESMGRSEKRELVSRLAVLLAHLLKWKFQSDRRNNSWKNTIDEQRDEVIELLEDSPSLQTEMDEKLDRAYKRAVLIAAIETSLPKEYFPENCPFVLANILNQEFFPE